jgi:hypothetical protein
MRSIIDRMCIRSFILFCFHFQLRIWPDCFYSSIRNNCRIFFSFICSLTIENSKPISVHILYSYIIANTFLLLDYILKSFICWEFKHLNSKLLMCGRNKKILLIISVVPYLTIKAYVLSHSFLLSQTCCARFSARYALTDSYFSWETSGWRWIFFFFF